MNDVDVVKMLWIAGPVALGNNYIGGREGQKASENVVLCGLLLVVRFGGSAPSKVLVRSKGWGWTDTR